MIGGLRMGDSYGNDKFHYISDLMPQGGTWTAHFSLMDICFCMIAIWECSPKASLHMLEGQFEDSIADMASFS